MICPGLNDTVYQNDTLKKWKIFTKIHLTFIIEIYYLLYTDAK